MNPELIELRPNRLLLNPNFNGYKLSLNQLSITTLDLTTSVDKIVNSSHYSFLHTKLYGLHNHLLGESVNDYDSLYFVDSEWNLCKTYLDPFTETFVEPINVWNIPKRRDRMPNDYNISFRIINKQNIAVLSDGTGVFYILDTGLRNDDDPFTVLYSDEVIEPEKGFLIIDAVYIEGQNKIDEMHVLLLSVEHNEAETAWYTIINWITLTKTENNKWGQVSLRELKSKGDVQYAYLSRNCQAVYIVSENGCKFTVNSDNPVKSDDNNSIKKIYKWKQNLEEISIQFPLTENFDKSLIQIKTENTAIEVKNGDEILLSGHFYKTISADLTTWSTENNLLEIILQKQHAGDMWVDLVPTDQNGEYFIDGTVAQEVHERLAHLCSDNNVIIKAIKLHFLIIR